MRSISTIYQIQSNNQKLNQIKTLKLSFKMIFLINLCECISSNYVSANNFIMNYSLRKINISSKKYQNVKVEKESQNLFF